MFEIGARKFVCKGIHYLLTSYINVRVKMQKVMLRFGYIINTKNKRKYF